MPRFHFNLRADGKIYHDPEGVECPDIAAARRHASSVARELMLNSEPRTRLWSLCVEARGEAPFDVFFADLDPGLARLSSTAQSLSAEVCRRHAALVDVISSARATMLESRVLISRLRGRPQLVYARNAGPALA